MSQCEWFDHDEDGFIGANTWVYALGQYATAGAMDVNGSGLVDMEDLLSFIPFFQHTCPTEWHDTTYNYINQLVLIEWKHHESDLDEDGSVSINDVLMLLSLL